MISPAFSFFTGRTKARQWSGAFALVQGRLDPRRSLAPDAPTLKPRGNNPRIVDDENVARRKKIRQVADDAVFERRAGNCGGEHDQHPRRIARLDRAQRYAISAKVEIKEVYAHSPSQARPEQPPGGLSLRPR